MIKNVNSIFFIKIKIFLFLFLFCFKTFILARSIGRLAPKSILTTSFVKKFEIDNKTRLKIELDHFDEIDNYHQHFKTQRYFFKIKILQKSHLDKTRDLYLHVNPRIEPSLVHNIETKTFDQQHLVLVSVEKKYNNIEELNKMIKCTINEKCIKIPENDEEVCVHVDVNFEFSLIAREGIYKFLMDWFLFVHNPLLVLDLDLTYKDKEDQIIVDTPIILNFDFDNKNNEFTNKSIFLQKQKLEQCPEAIEFLTKEAIELIKKKQNKKTYFPEFFQDKKRYLYIENIKNKFEIDLNKLNQNLEFKIENELFFVFFNYNLNKFLFIFIPDNNSRHISQIQKDITDKVKDTNIKIIYQKNCYHFDQKYTYSCLHLCHKSQIKDMKPSNHSSSKKLSSYELLKYRRYIESLEGLREWDKQDIKEFLEKSKENDEYKIKELCDILERMNKNDWFNINKCSSLYQINTIPIKNILNNLKIRNNKKEIVEN